MECENEHCGCQEEQDIRVSFCPNCNSTNIKYVFELANLYGIMPKQRCLNCKREGIFPLLITNKKEIERKTKKQNKKTQTKKQKKKR